MSEKFSVIIYSGEKIKRIAKTFYPNDERLRNAFTSGVSYGFKNPCFDTVRKICLALNPDLRIEQIEQLYEQLTGGKK